LQLHLRSLGEEKIDRAFCRKTIRVRWFLVGEIVGVNNFNGHKRDDPISGLIGIQYVLSDDSVLDAGVEIGINRAAPDYRLTAGLTFFFKP
jgi:hypothetical protein